MIFRRAINLFIRPQFRLCQNSKTKLQIKELQTKISHLKKLEQECNHIEEQLMYYQEIRQIHKLIVAQQKGVCVEYLLDQIRLIMIQLDQNMEIDQHQLNEMFELDFDTLSYQNIIIRESPEKFKEYYKNQVIKGLCQLRILYQFNHGIVEDLKPHCEQFKEAIEYIYNYTSTYLKNSVTYHPKMCEELKYSDMSSYHNYLAKMAINANDVQEGIHHQNKSIDYLQKAINIDKEIIKNDSNQELVSFAQQRLLQQQQQLGYDYQALSNIEKYLGNLSESRKLDTQAMELFLHTIGKQSIPFINSYCSLAYSYMDEDINKSFAMIDQFYEQIKHLENKELILHLRLYHVPLFFMLDKDIADIGNDIQDLLAQNVRVHDKKLLINHYISMVEVVGKQNQANLTQKYIENALEISKTFPDQTRSNYVVALIHQFRTHQIEDPVILTQQSLEILENSQFRYDQFKNKLLDNDQLSLLFQIEYYVVYLQLHLIGREVINMPIDIVIARFLVFFNNFRNFEILFSHLMYAVWEYSNLLQQCNQINEAIIIIEEVLSKLQQLPKSEQVIEEIQNCKNIIQQWTPTVDNSTKIKQ